MQIKEVTCSNLKLFFDAVIASKTNENYHSDFGSNTSSLLNHCSVSFHLTDISPLEEMYIKDFCNGSIIETEVDLDSDPMITSVENINVKESEYDVYRELSTNIKTLESVNHLSSTIYKDDDYKIDMDGILHPIGCIRKSIIAVVRGTLLFSIFTLEPIKMLMEVYDVKTPYELKDVNLDKSERLESYMVSNFMNGVYRHMMNRVTTIDLISDSFLNKEYHSFSDGTFDVSIEHVNTPFSSVNLFGDDNNERLKSLEASKKIIDFNMDDMLRSTELFFLCTCSFYTFLEMYAKLPIGVINDYEDLKIVMGRETSIIDMTKFPSYTSRIKSLLVYLHHLKKITNDISSFNLKRYNFIPGSTPITFTLRLTLKDMNSIMLPLQKSLKDLFHDSSYVYREMNEIIEKTKSLSISVYNILKK